MTSNKPVIRNPHHLLLVKHLYEESRQLAERADVLSHTKAIILLDLSVELMLNNIILSFDPNLTVNTTKGSQGLDRKTLWGNAVTALSRASQKKLSESREMGALHAQRNLVQHTGAEPTQTEVRRFLIAAETMLSGAFRDAYSLDFQSFRLWDTVPNNDLRRWLQESDDYLSEGNATACIVGCIAAHQMIMDTIREQTKLRRFRSSLGYDIRDGNVREALGELRRELIEDIEHLENEVVAIGVGLPVMDTRRFLQLTRIISVSMADGGRLQTVRRRDKRDSDPTVANFMLEYLVRLIQLAEDGYPGVLDTKELKVFPKEQNLLQRKKV